MFIIICMQLILHNIHAYIFVYSHSYSLNYVSPRMTGVDGKIVCDGPIALILSLAATAAAPSSSCND